MLFNPWYSLSIWQSLSCVCGFLRYSWQAIDRRQTPPHQPIALRTIMSLKSFSWFLDMSYLQALAIRSTLFHVDSLLLTKDMSRRKSPVPCRTNNCWVSNCTYAKTEDSVKTERNGSHCRTTVERKRNANFILAPTVYKYLHWPQHHPCLEGEVPHFLVEEGLTPYLQQGKNIHIHVHIWKLAPSTSMFIHCYKTDHPGVGQQLVAYSVTKSEKTLSMLFRFSGRG